ncbi:MAG: hypothetical protein WC408_03795 [Candidatus Micrarchaeia archaeon]
MNYSRLPNSSWNASQGVGRIYLDPGYAYGWDGAAWSYYSSTHAFLRGGDWDDGADAGAFALYLSYAPSGTGTAIGFRCSR